MVIAENDPADRKTPMIQKKGVRVFRRKVLEQLTGNRIQCSSPEIDNDCQVLKGKELPVAGSIQFTQEA